MATTELTLGEAATAARDRLGAILFTVTVITPDGAEISRVHSTHPEVYPLGGRKRMDPSQTSPLWKELVVEGQQPFVGPDRAAVREFFFDWETIEALGCGSIINTPVVHEGKTIGSINFLGPEGTMTEQNAAGALEITAQATPAVAAALAAAFPEVQA